MIMSITTEEYSDAMIDVVTHLELLKIFGQKYSEEYLEGLKDGLVYIGICLGALHADNSEVYAICRTIDDILKA